MRLCEEAMVQLINDGKSGVCGGNTRVERSIVDGGFVFQVYLHEQRIAMINGGGVHVDENTLRRWNTQTTRSRLRALGVKFKPNGGWVVDGTRFV